MSPLANAAFTLALGCCAVIPPFLLGRWTKSTRCGRCDMRIRNAADRARANGEHVARLRERAVSPDAVRRQADDDRAERRHLLEQPRPLRTGGVVRPIGGPR